MSTDITKDVYTIDKEEVDQLLERLAREVAAVQERYLANESNMEEEIDAAISRGIIASYCNLFGINEAELLDRCGVIGEYRN